jgi:hypothetical protein
MARHVPDPFLFDHATPGVPMLVSAGVPTALGPVLSCFRDLGANA